MLSENFNIVRFAAVVLCLTALSGLLIYPFLRGQSAATGTDELQKEMEAVKAEIERPGGGSPSAEKRYERLAYLLSECNPFNPVKKPDSGNPFAPANSLCINGALAIADPAYNRVLSSSTGTGVGNGTVGNCSLSGSGNAVRYDSYDFSLSGCAAYPTEITATLCGPAGCQHLGNVDTVLSLYRRVAAGDPLTGANGLPGAFNPASACTNAVAGSDDLGTTSGTPNNPGGATCNQTVTANCVAPCTTPSAAGGLSGFRRNLGSGRFTLVVGGFGNSTVGNYNLYINAPAAGCSVNLVAPTAANSKISGRVTTANGNGIRNATVTVSGGNLTQPLTVKSGTFGAYNFDELASGATYIVTVSAKKFSFENPTRVVNLSEDISDADFVSGE